MIGRLLLIVFIGGQGLTFAVELCRMAESIHASCEATWHLKSDECFLEGRTGSWRAAHGWIKLARNTWW